MDKYLCRPDCAIRGKCVWHIPVAAVFQHAAPRVVRCRQNRRCKLVHTVVDGGVAPRHARPGDLRAVLISRFMECAVVAPHRDKQRAHAYDSSWLALLCGRGWHGLWGPYGCIYTRCLANHHRLLLRSEAIHSRHRPFGSEVKPEVNPNVKLTVS